MKVTIQRDYNLDLQVKGVAGKATRVIERMVELGEGKTNFVRVEKKFLNLLGDIKKVRKTNFIDNLPFLEDLFLCSAKTIFTDLLFTVEIF